MLFNEIHHKQLIKHLFLNNKRENSKLQIWSGPIYFCFDLQSLLRIQTLSVTRIEINFVEFRQNYRLHICQTNAVNSNLLQV